MYNLGKYNIILFIVVVFNRLRNNRYFCLVKVTIVYKCVFDKNY